MLWLKAARMPERYSNQHGFLRARRAPNRGFSLIESLTVMAIMMIVATIGFSAFQIFDSEQTAAKTAKRFSHALSTAQGFAIEQNGFFRVVLDLENTVFWIDEIPDPALVPNVLVDQTIVIRPKIISPEDVGKLVTVEGVLDSGGGALQTSGFQNFIFGPDGGADRDTRVFFFRTRDDPTSDRNIFTVRLYGPTGSNEVFERQRI